MGCFAIYPREVYLIFPFDEQGKIAGVYVGSSCCVSTRIYGHLTIKGYDTCGEQKELHELMRKNGFAYEVVDKIDKWQNSYIEYDWVDFFLNNYEIRVFNSHKKGCVIRDWKRLENPKGRISHYSLCELKEKQKHDQ